MKNNAFRKTIITVCLVLIFFTLVGFMAFLYLRRGMGQVEVTKDDTEVSHGKDVMIEVVHGSGEPDAVLEDSVTEQEVKPWEIPVEPIADFTGQLPRIICWGDSLTESIDSRTAYPDKLEKLTGADVINYGVRSETTRTIAMREGAVPVYVSGCTISENALETVVNVTSKSGESVPFLKFGDRGINPCNINGITGTLSIDSESGLYYFTRSSEGEAVTVEDGSRLTTYGMADRRQDDVLVIFSGTNDGPDTSTFYDVIALQRQMLSYAKCEKYVIIGLTCKKVIPEVDEVNEILAQEYKEHFLNIRDYLLSYGLDEAGIVPSAQDRVDLENGEIPESLRKDYVHGNEYFYDILAKQVYRKMQYLGYLPLNEDGNSVTE